MIRWTTPVSRKRITYQTERVGTTKIRRVIVHTTRLHHGRYNTSLCRQVLLIITRFNNQWDSGGTECELG